MRIHTGSRTCAIFLATAVVFLAACGGTSATAPLATAPAETRAIASAAPTTDANAQLVAAAKAEGSLVVYGSPRDESMAADAAGFEKAYGIKVTSTRLAGAPLTARVDTEVKAGQPAVDVLFTPDEAAIDTWSKNGTLGKLPAVTFPNRTDFVAPIQVVAQGLVYNTNRVKAADVPKTFADLLDPKWSGQIVIGNAKRSPAYAQTYYALLHDAKYGQAYFEKLATQKIRMFEDTAVLNNLVASGEAALGMISFPTDVQTAKDAAPGTPMAFTYLDITTAAYTYMAVMAKAKHPNAAQLYAKWMMSPEGQAAHNGGGRASSVLPNIPGTLPAAPSDKLRNVTSLDVSKEFTAMGNLFDRLFAK